MCHHRVAISRHGTIDRDTRPLNSVADPHASRPLPGPVRFLCLLLGLMAAAAAWAQETVTLRSEGDRAHDVELQAGDLPLLAEITELGRDVRLELWSGDGKLLGSFETPGETLGYLPVFIPRDSAARRLRVLPERPSSAPGRFSLSLRPPDAEHVGTLLAITDAARGYAQPGASTLAADRFLAASSGDHPWSSWATYWAALAENEFGSRSVADRLVQGLKKTQTPRLLSILVDALDARLQMYLGNLGLAEARYAQHRDTLATLASAEPEVYLPALASALEYQCVVVRVYQGKNTDACSRSARIAAELSDPYLMGLVESDMAAHEILNTGRPDLALGHAAKATAWFRETGNFHLDDAGNAYLTLAKAHEMLGQFSEAKLAIQQSLELIEQQDRTTNLGWAYRRGAELAELTGDLERAVVYGEKAVQILKASGDRELASRAETSLASACLRLGMPAVAASHLESVTDYQTTACAEQADGERCGLLTESLGARVLLAQARATAGTEAASREITVIRGALREALAGDLPASAVADLHLKAADAFLALGDEAASIGALDRVVELHDRHGNDLMLMQSLSRSSKVHLARGDYARAIRDAEAVTDMLAELEVELASERIGPLLRESLYDQFAVQIAARVELADADLLPGVFDIAVASLGPRRLLGELPSDAELDARLAELAIAIADTDESAPGRLEITRAVEAVEARLLELSPAGTVGASKPSLASVQAALRPNEAVLHYLWWDDTGWALRVTSSDIVLHPIPVVTASDLKALRRLTELNPPNAYADWLVLSRALLPPLEHGTDRLYVIPDGPLRSIPLGALPHPDGSLDPLLDRYVISYLSSYASIVERRDSRVSVEAGAVIFSNPGRDDTDPVRQNDAWEQSGSMQAPGSWLRRLGALPRSAEEARTIAGLFGTQRVAMFTGAEASRARLQAAVQLEKPIYHFATHGYFSSDYSDIGGLVLAQADDSGELRKGLFTIQDARSTRLTADLVVLNGCETGLGSSLRGEGVTGITRAFVDSGAKHAVSTLWKVPDRPAMEIIAGFYRSLLANGGRDVAAALASAQRQFLRDNPRLRWRPGHWGAYIHYRR